MLYFSPKSFPHLAPLSEQQRRSVLLECRSPFESIYVVLILILVVFLGSISKVLVDSIVLGGAASLAISTAITCAGGIVAYLIYINKYLYKITLANIKRKDNE